jgi:hypothetical protein
MLKVRKTKKQEKAYIIPSASGSHVFPFFFFLRRFIRKLKPDVPLQHNRFFHLDIEVYGVVVELYVYAYIHIFLPLLLHPSPAAAAHNYFQNVKCTGRLYIIILHYLFLTLLYAK